MRVENRITVVCAVPKISATGGRRDSSSSPGTRHIDAHEVGAMNRSIMTGTVIKQPPKSANQQKQNA